MLSYNLEVLVMFLNQQYRVLLVFFLLINITNFSLTDFFLICQIFSLSIHLQHPNHFSASVSMTYNSTFWQKAGRSVQLLKTDLLDFVEKQWQSATQSSKNTVMNKIQWSVVHTIPARCVIFLLC